MDHVLTLKKAREWFLANHSGSVRCTTLEPEDRVCHSYPEAEDYYKHHGPDAIPNSKVIEAAEDAVEALQRLISKAKANI